MKRTSHFSRQVGRDDQQPLRRHEGADAGHQRIGVVEGAERGGVVREDAEDAPDVLDFDGRSHPVKLLWWR